MRFREALNWHPYAAMAIGIVILAKAALHGGRPFVACACVLTMLLPCIIWPDAMGSAVGFSHVTRSSPGPVLAVVAWGLLLLVAWRLIL